MEFTSNLTINGDSFTSIHQNQRIFLKQPQSPSEKKFANLNMLDEVSCWSESLKSSKVNIDINDIQLQSNPNDSNIVEIEYSNKGYQNSLPSLNTKFFKQEKPILSPSPYKKRMQKFFNYPNEATVVNPDCIQTVSSVCNSKRKRTITCSRQTNPQNMIQNRNSTRATQNLTSFYLCGMLKIKTKLIRFYKNFTFHGRTLLLNAQVKDRINDLSDYYLQTSKHNSFHFLFQNIKDRIKKLMEYTNFPQLSIFTKFILLSIFTFINYWLLYAYSCILIFQADDEWIPSFLFFYQLIWSLEIFIRVYAGSFSLTQSNTSQTAYNFWYLKQKVLFDIIPLAILFFWSYLNSLTIIKSVVFLKLINVSHDYIKIQKHLCQLIKKYYVVQIINLIQKLFLIGHSIACLWYLIGQIEKIYFGVNETWVDTLHEEDRIWWKIYILSLYWALTLMTTGSNVAQTVTQACFASIIMLFITITFGYILNVIGYILQEMDETALQKRKDISILNDYMRQRNISKTLRALVNKNLDYYYKQNLSIKQENNRKVLQKISNDLQNQILSEYSKQIFSKINILISNFSADSLKELSLLVIEEHYIPDQLIFKGEDSQESSMMFIISGSVELNHKFHTSKKQNLTLKKLSKGDVFGQVQFFTGISEQHIVQSKEFTTILKIQRQDFIDIIKKYENEYEVFCQIKDNLLLYKQGKEINLFCEVCKSSCHSSLECHLVHFDKIRSSYLIGARQSLKQNRKGSTRLNKFKQKSLKLLKYLQYSVRTYRDNTLLNAQYTNQVNEINCTSNDQSLSSSFISDKEGLNNQGESENSNYAKSKLESFKILSDNHNNMEDFASLRSQAQETMSMNSPDLFAFINSSQKKIEDYREEFIREAQKIILEKAQQNPDHSNSNLSLEQKEKRRNSKKNSIEKERISIKDITDCNPWSALKHSNSKVQIKQPNSHSTIFQASQEEVEELKAKSSKNEVILPRKCGFRKNDPNKQQQHFNDRRQTNFNLIELIKLQNYIKKYDTRVLGLLEVENPWGFEILKDFKYYFPQGNSKQQILKFSRYIKKKNKESLKIKIKK